MEVIVNKQRQDVPENATIPILLEKIQVTHQKGIAIAVNEQVIPKAKWAKTTLNQNDNVLLIEISQGG